jgi:hypothetical protein
MRRYQFARVPVSMPAITTERLLFRVPEQKFISCGEEDTFTESV